MERMKSILLGATTLAVLGTVSQANAQSTNATGLTLLAPPPTVSQNNDIFPDSLILSRGVTADGLTVLTVASTPSGSPNEATRNLNQNIFLWTDGVMRTISVTHPTPAIGSGNGYFSTNMSGDGNTIIGSRAVIANRLSGGTSSYNAATIWTQSTGLQFFASTGANEFVAFAQPNMDGNLIAVTARQSPLLGDGSSNPARFDPRTVYRYSPTNGFQSLGSLGATVSMTSQAISGLGDIIAGGSTDLAASNLDTNGDPINNGAWRWSALSGLSVLPDLAASPLNGTVSRNTSVAGISRDGATIVGGSVGDDGRRQAVYWRGGNITSLGFLPGFAAPAEGDYGTNAIAASADGSVVVGAAGTGINNLVGWHWTAANGMQDLNVLASNASLDLNGFVLADTTGISDNGQIITGNAYKGGIDSLGLPIIAQGYVLSIAQVATTFDTTARLIVTIRLPGVTQTAIVNQTFSTQVDALLNGNNVFTRTVSDPITGAGGVTALADARASLQVGGGLRRLVIGAPVLISNTTTALPTTNAVVDVASGTSTSTATVNTLGPATVATGDLGTCATAATNNTNPTGCSLPGTLVAVDSGILNTNVFTSTLNTVTPTTTPTVNQLISAKWQVSATAGNQFGTVHALAGVAAFDRGDRLIGQLLGLGGGQGESATRVARAAMPVGDANSLGGGESGLTMFGGYFGNWSHIDADASVPVARVKGNTNGFVLGLEKGLDAARVGVAVDHGTSDYTVRDATYPETLKFKHTQVALFAGWNSGAFSLNGAAAYGFGTARTSLTTPTTPATASRDVKSWALGAQGGYTVPLGKSASVELVGGVRHVAAKLNSFTEVGGPSPLQGGDQTITRTRVYGGVQAQAGIALGSVTLTPRIHARYAHDGGDASGVADLVFASAPNGPVMQAVGPGVGRAVAELGGSLDVQVSGNVHVWAGYDGTFRKGARGHAAKAGLTVAF